MLTSWPACCSHSREYMTRATRAPYLLVILALGCGASKNAPDGAATGGSGTGGAGMHAGGGNGGSAGTRSSGGSGGSGSSSGGSGESGGSGGAEAGANGISGASSGGKAASGGSGAAAGAGASSSGATSSGSGGSEAGGDGGSAGERAVECTGATPYFPDFERGCSTADDCVAVAHQTNCCGAQLVTGINASEKSAFDTAAATCAEQYPACGCAAFGVDVEDGTRVDFVWEDQVEVTCDGGTCKARYSGTSFACGTSRCTEGQYCVQSSGGPAGTPTSYMCNPTECTDCSCITMTGCTCSEAGGHVTVTCLYP